MSSSFVPFSAAEFPCDNPDLHGGVSWICLQVNGAPRAVARPRAKFLRVPAPAVLSLDGDAPSERISVTGAAIPARQDAVVAFQEVPIEVRSLTLDAKVDAGSVAANSDIVASLGTLHADTDATEQLDDEVLNALLESAARLDDDVLGSLLETLDLVASSDLEPSSISVDAGLITAGDLVVGNDASADLSSLGATSPIVDEAPPATEPVPHQAAAEALVATEPAPPPAAAETTGDGASQDAYATFVAALVGVALQAGATRAAASLPMLLQTGRFDVSALTEDARRDLLAAKILTASGGSVVPADGFAAIASAWREVLRGETNDLSACGTSTLDRWGANLLEAFGVGRGGPLDVRRELRRRGVAAFGMLQAA